MFVNILPRNVDSNDVYHWLTISRRAKRCTTILQTLTFFSRFTNAAAVYVYYIQHMYIIYINTRNRKNFNSDMIFLLHFRAGRKFSGVREQFSFRGKSAGGGGGVYRNSFDQIMKTIDGKNIEKL